MKGATVKTFAFQNVPEQRLGLGEQKGEKL